MKLKYNGIIYDVEYAIEVLNLNTIKVFYPEVLLVHNTNKFYFTNYKKIIILNDSFFYDDTYKKVFSYYTNNHPLTKLKIDLMSIIHNR